MLTSEETLWNKHEQAFKIIRPPYFSANKYYVCLQLQENLKSQAIWLEEKCLPLCLCYRPKNSHRWWLKKCLGALGSCINIFLPIVYNVIVVSQTSTWNAKYVLVQRLFLFTYFSCHYFFFSVWSCFLLILANYLKLTWLHYK